MVSIRPNTNVIAITPIAIPSFLTGPISWEGLTQLPNVQTIHKVSMIERNLYLQCQWKDHHWNDTTQFMIYSPLTENKILKITGELLKPHQRIQPDEQFQQEPKGSQQLQRNKNNSQKRTRKSDTENRGFIAWRGRVF